MGWNGSKGNGNASRGALVSSPRRNVALISVFRLSTLCLITLVIGLMAWLMFRQPEKPTPERRNPHATYHTTANHIPEHKVASSQPAKQDAKVDKPEEDANPVWANAKGLDPKLFPYTDGRKVIETRTNKWMAVDICIMPNGVRRKVRRNVSKQLFKCSTDEVLLQALSTGGDEVGPPIPFSEDMEDEFRESLKSPIVISDDDTPEQRKAKEMVMVARESVIAQLNEGRTFFDAVTEHIETQGANQSARETVMDAVEKLKEDGDGDLIEEYLKESNKILEGMGASSIKLSDVEDTEENNPTSN